MVFCVYVRQFLLAHRSRAITVGSWAAAEPNDTGSHLGLTNPGLEQCSHRLGRLLATTPAHPNAYMLP
ncbi:hypothetical protein [Desulfurococcus amylolyticus]|uniref:hypothetical protein n=1 Tax=Desulfurococcus amylolyticus TaxID=94694 RepID=UPI0012FECEE3|nr:hypothetical protein [Desulfurococcus amylolyticus]